MAVSAGGMAGGGKRERRGRAGDVVKSAGDDGMRQRLIDVPALGTTELSLISPHSGAVC